MKTHRREDLNGIRLRALSHGRQVADHSAWAVGQGHLDRVIQILDDVSERAGNLKHHNLAEKAPSDRHLKATDRADGRLHSTGGRVPREPGREHAGGTGINGMKRWGCAWWLNHGELDPVVP
jgi:hypothetical protein